MRKIDRLHLLDQIGRELQARFTFTEIDTYLKGFGINLKKEWSRANSKWVYTKEILSDESDEILAEIAEELGIERPYTTQTARESRYWLTGHLRLFISHCSQHKVTVGHLQKSLRRFGISGFVAHEDIEPTREWLQEVEKALFSMDACLAVLIPEFPKSSWTDHEVGIAVGRGVLVVPLRKGLDPYGFIGKYQGLQAAGKTVKQVADEIYRILVSSPFTADKMFSVIVRMFVSSRTKEDCMHWLDLLAAEDVPKSHLEKLVLNVSQNAHILDSSDVRDRLEQILSPQGLALPTAASEPAEDDDIPF